MRVLSICLLALVSLLGACGSSRTTFARYPGSPPAFDRSKSSPEALAIVDKVLEAAGGVATWEKVKQIRWTQAKIENGNTTARGEQAWDRWNARHWGKKDGDEGATVVAYEIYGTYATSYVEKANGKKQIIDGPDKGRAVGYAKTAFQLDVTPMFIHFLLVEPGANVASGGIVRDGETEYDQLDVSFGDGDTAHHDLVYRVIIDKTTHLVKRVDIEKRSTMERVGYELSDWTDVGGLKFPATRKNLGSQEVSKASDIKIGSPQDELFMTPLL
ncbi:MAG: hypothetical protein KF773_31160 [Deltaproteobacteria bacterium]|nr:hypothetical protein [Deltaproteobacteria bacterium]MCW5806223.1 hypothetical protein [Deltaproteobacteria bacterium]